MGLTLPVNSSPVLFVYSCMLLVLPNRFNYCLSCFLTPCEATNSWTWSTAWVEGSHSTQKSWSSGKARLGWTSMKYMARLKRYICRVYILLNLCNSSLLDDVLMFVFKEHSLFLPSRFCECFGNLLPWQPLKEHPFMALLSEPARNMDCWAEMCSNISINVLKQIPSDSDRQEGRVWV